MYTDKYSWAKNVYKLVKHGYITTSLNQKMSTEWKHTDSHSKKKKANNLYKMYKRLIKKIVHKNWGILKYMSNQYD